jgi:hypothetical protein
LLVPGDEITVDVAHGNDPGVQVVLTAAAQQQTLTLTPGFYDVSAHGMLAGRAVQAGATTAEVRAGQDTRVDLKLQWVADPSGTLTISVTPPTPPDAAAGGTTGAGGLGGATGGSGAMSTGGTAGTDAGAPIADAQPEPTTCDPFSIPIDGTCQCAVGVKFIDSRYGYLSEETLTAASGLTVSRTGVFAADGTQLMGSLAATKGVYVMEPPAGDGDILLILNHFSFGDPLHAAQEVDAYFFAGTAGPTHIGKASLNALPYFHWLTATADGRAVLATYCGVAGVSATISFQCPGCADDAACRLICPADADGGGSAGTFTTGGPS